MIKFYNLKEMIADWWHTFDVAYALTPKSIKREIRYLHDRCDYMKACMNAKNQTINALHAEKRTREIVSQITNDMVAVPPPPKGFKLVYYYRKC